MPDTNASLYIQDRFAGIQFFKKTCTALLDFPISNTL